MDEAVDFELPGAIPLVWKRYYSSSRRGDKTATLGRGWAHAFEQRVTATDTLFVLREAQGREVYFAKVPEGESTFHRRERMTLRRDGKDAFSITCHDNDRTLVFSASREGGPALLRSICDAWGNAITLDYDGERLIALTDTAGRGLRLRWREGRITRVEVRDEGRAQTWVDYDYSPAGCLRRVTSALGSFEEMAYDRHHRMTSTQLATGATFYYEYEADTGRCKRTWGPKGLYAIELSYDREAKTTRVSGEEPRVVTWNDQGLATRIALPDGTVLEETAYDEDGYRVAAVNGAGEGEQWYYDDRGLLQRSIDANGNATVWERDANGAPRRRVDPDGCVTALVHDDKGRLISVQKPGALAYALAYDARGRLVSIHEGGAVLRAYEYNARHEVIAETDGRGSRTTYRYDALGRPVARTDALGRTTSVTYDRAGRAVSVRQPDGSLVQRTFDARGDLLAEIDPAGRTTTFERDGMGVLTAATFANGERWTIAYTTTEKVREITNPRGDKHTFVRDDAGRVVEERTFDGRVIRYSFGLSGRVARVEEGESVRSITYDRLGRVTGEEASDGTAITYRRDRVGRLAGAVLRDEDGAIIETSVERDAIGRVVADHHGGAGVHYRYDDAGRLGERVLSNGAATRFGYDREGALLSVEHGGTSLRIDRDAAGREIRRGDALGRVAVQSTYDALDRLIEQRASAQGADNAPSVRALRRFSYDRVGRVTRVDDVIAGTSTFTHGPSGALLTANGLLHEVFSYDPAGALAGALEGGEGDDQTPWTIGPGNKLLAARGARYTYDDRGRRVRKADRGGETAYRWDAFNRLREVTLPAGARVVMTYDAFGRRIRKDVFPEGGGAAKVTRFVWDGDVIASEASEARGERTFVYRPGTFLPILHVERGVVHVVVHDLVGTPKELLSPDGSLAWSGVQSSEVKRILKPGGQWIHNGEVQYTAP